MNDRRPQRRLEDAEEAIGPLTEHIGKAAEALAGDDLKVATKQYTAALVAAGYIVGQLAEGLLRIDESERSGR